MRIRRLDLVKFGPFTDQRLDLGQGEQGLHLVFGLNEAGKSALLRAIHGVLFGIPHQSRDAFLHKPNTLRIGATLENQNGATLAYVRRKGRSKTILNPTAGDAPFGDDVLSPFLAGIDNKTFARVYGIDHQQLEEGGKELQRLRGLAGESLLAAGMGITDLSGVLSGLDAEAKGLFERRKNSKSEIQKARREHDDWRKRRGEAEVSAHRWQTLHRTLRDKREHQQAIVKQLEELRFERERLKLLHRVLSFVGKRAKLQDDLDQLSDVTVLPAEYSVKNRDQHQETLREAERVGERARRELEGDDGLRGQIAAINVPEVLLEQERNIDVLTKQLGAYHGFCKDLPKRVAEQKELLRQAKIELAELGLDVSLTDVGSLRLPSDVIDNIQTLGLDEKTVRPKPGTLRRSIERQRKTLTEAREHLQSRASPREAASLRAAVERVRKKGEIEDQLENLRVGLASIQEEGKQQLVALGLYHGSVDQAETVAVPLRKTIERFARELAEIDTKLSTSVSKVDEVRRRQGEDQHKLDELHRGGVLPSATDLAAVRTRREDAWQKVRGAWMGPLQRGEDQVDPAIATPASATALAATYEKSVTKADDVADALREHAALVTKVAFLKEQIRSANSDLAVLERQRDPHDKSRAELDLKWSGLWSKPGIDDPLPPSEMLEWLDRFDELRNTSKAIRKCGTDVTKLERAISVYIEDLGEQLTELDAPAPREDESLAALLDRCDRLVTQVGEEQKEREEQHKAIVDGEGELARMVEEADRAEQKLAQWQLQWDKAMAALRCSPESSAAQANTRIGLLQALFKDLDDAAALNARIESMQDGQLQFEKDVSRMAKLVAEDLASVPAAQAANELASRTKRANRDVDRLAELQERAKGLEDDLRDVEEPRRTAQEALASLCKLAGVDRDDQLAVTEEASTAKRDLQERLRTTDEELLGLGGGIPVEELIEQASGKNASSLTANIETLDDTIKNAEKVLETASGDVRDAQREIEFVDGSAAAAEADQEMLGIVGRAHEAAEQYIRLRLAASLLRRHVEDQRAKTQDPVLQRARELFRKLTCGSFADLKIDYDPDDKPFLLGDRGDGSEPVPLEGFSDGTADQLYLALRIAYLERNLASGEPMPIIADDILVNFDDQRARATLEVLAELSHKTQVLLLTHHDHLRQLARDVVPADALFEHELPTAQADD